MGCALTAALPYLDHNASTPCAKEVLAAMEPFWRGHFANPSSRGHRAALEAGAAVEQARRELGRCLGCDPGWIHFTSGATEADNLAIKGVCEARMDRGRHLVTVVSEHRAVLDPCRYLAGLGFTLTELAVDASGRLDPLQLEATLRADTILVSVMAANNETGVLQDIPTIAAVCRRREVPFHCDAAQAFGHVPLACGEAGPDLIALSAHKLYGPKGMGALVVRDGLRLAPQLHGGGQEGGLRSGTVSTPLVVGFAKAAQLAHADRGERSARLGRLREQLWQGLLQGLPAWVDPLRNGRADQTLPHTLNVSFRGVDGARLHSTLRRRIAVSSGSSCSNGKPSHVLMAMGRSRGEAEASIRFGLGRQTRPVEIDRAVEAVTQTLASLRH
ncbi:MAG: cysteine desulfurase [Aphanocapsa feldmannii 277cV]|uniref:Cysteine desulfurase n=2 Tax=Aphanocapsa feldmannii TaxID=192050 RepID=A0A524RKJ7_9CHRO|nr:MAG: cysteine desulfurase [Aphanocapsa feldmannii 288cV]TGG90130.1 MAG: cysteine desulfurase [Aphanocapsa feldmannii 277cV]TGH23926.1 MAG: cysteine desulfurase [Aphanocapsa feldmannii 277cI]